MIITSIIAVIMAYMLVTIVQWFYGKLFVIPPDETLFVIPPDGKVFRWRYAHCGTYAVCKEDFEYLVLKSLNLDSSMYISPLSENTFQKMCRGVNNLMEELELDICLSYPGILKSTIATKTPSVAYSIVEQIQKGCVLVDETIVKFDLTECFSGVYDTDMAKKIIKDQRVNVSKNRSYRYRQGQLHRR